MYVEQITQRLGIAAAVNPQVINNQSKTTGSVDLAKFRRAFFILEIGAVTGGGAITAQLVQSANSNLSSPANVPGSSTSLTGLNTANRQYTFEVRADQVTAEYVGLQITETGSQNVTVCAVGYGDEAAHKPGNAQNDATVVTQNVVS